MESKFKYHDSIPPVHYFPAYSNELDSLVMVQFIKRHGWQGYGIIAALRQILTKSPDFQISVNEIDVISYKLQVDGNLLSDILKSCFELKIFAVNNDMFCDPSQKKFLDEQTKKIKILKQSGRKAAAKRWHSKDFNDRLPNKQPNEQPNKQPNEQPNEQPNANRIELNRIELNRIELNKKSNSLADKSACFKKCVDAFFKKYEKIVGVKPAWGGADGNHLNMLIGKIKNTLIMNNTEPTDEKVVEAFTAMLCKLPEFYARNLDIKTINSSYNKIISEIRQSNNGQAQIERVLAKRRNERNEL